MTVPNTDRLSDNAAVIREFIERRMPLGPFPPALDALAALEQELADANECIRKMLHDKDEDVEAIVARAEAAEAEVARLREALLEIAGQAIEMSASGLDITDGEAVEIARAALAPDTEEGE